MPSSLTKIELLYGSILGLLGGIFVIWMISAIPTSSGFFWVSFVIIASSVLLWSIKGGKNWWIAFVAMTAVGGVFWVDFKIYPTEIGMLLAVMALFYATVIRGKDLRQDRPKISWAFNLLIIYLFLHMLASLYIAKIGIMSGAGSIIRTYSDSMIFLLFGCLFYKFGQTESIKNVFIIILIVNLIRIGIGLYDYFFYYNPNYSEPGWKFVNMALDLRTSALYQINTAIIIFYIIKNRIIKLSIILLIILSLFVLLLGQSRVSVLAAILTIILWALIEKKFGLSILILSIFFSLFIFINTNIKSFKHLPFDVRRSLSFAVLDKNKIFSNYPFVSDEWHFDLFKLGFDKWSDSTLTLFWGNRIDPSDVWRFDSYDLSIQAKIASAMGRYESTLWTVLATLGIIGFSLYVWIFTFLFSKIIPVVKRDGIKSFNHAVYAVATISFMLMILLSWIRGGFPGYEIMLGVLAKALYDDNNRDKKIRQLRSVGYY